MDSDENDPNGTQGKRGGLMTLSISMMQQTGPMLGCPGRTGRPIDRTRSGTP